MIDKPVIDDEDIVEAQSDGEDQHVTTDADDVEPAEPGKADRGSKLMRIVAYVVLPALTVILAVGAGYLWWAQRSIATAAVRAETVKVATDTTAAMLSYKPETVEHDIAAARDRLTGKFKDSYTSLTNDVVIPGSKQKKITALANVPAAASVSATDSHAVVLVFVNQSILMGNDPPSSTASSVRVTLDKIDGRWMISDFEPV
ncbi:hypothetical protein BOO86_15245 [Mycobacterium sp. CBMA 234]|uniref:hypothetical protein n=1 Tax=Mycolicibacterium sp. CBMA 234 TaxID=1918495 RepID=UPI00192E4152|nr:hypothetical protein [Mycolicibacterium sp. CBMA 234]MUL65829.1 hypothetical protein [Mycolicibacterium sp. CBMA 234]